MKGTVMLIVSRLRVQITDFGLTQGVHDKTPIFLAVKLFVILSLPKSDSPN